jgi:hypothetical protein
MIAQRSNSHLFPGALRQSQPIGAPCFVTLRLLSPSSLALPQLLAVSR